MPQTDRTKCLLVDDVEENLIALEALLQRDGLDILKAQSGPEALELLLAHDDVALALLDVQMPEMNGFELAELIRGSERTRHIPLIFMTAGSREQNWQFRGYESGAVDFLYKPIDPHMLTNKASVFFELHRRKQALAHELRARTEALRERSRGLTNLVAERRRGLERELAAVADEGVVETLVAEAARTREQLIAVDADAETLGPAQRDTEAAEHAAAELRATHDAKFAAPQSSAAELRLAAEAELADARRAVEQADARATATERDLTTARTDLAAVDAELATIDPQRAEADELEQAAATLRAEVDARSATMPELTEEARAVRAAEEALERADAEWRFAINNECLRGSHTRLRRCVRSRVLSLGCSSQSGSSVVRGR